MRAGFGILKALDDVAARHNALPAQIALAWLIAKPMITAPIVSATSLKQLGEIMKAPRIKLSRTTLPRSTRPAPPESGRRPRAAHGSASPLRQRTHEAYEAAASCFSYQGACSAGRLSSR